MDDAARAIYLAPIGSLTKNALLIQRQHLYFPVAPQEFSHAGSGNWVSNNVIGLGEIAHPGGPSLGSFTMSSFFPSFYSRICKGLRDPDQFLNPRASCHILESIRDTNDVVWLIIGTELAANGLDITGDSDSNQLMEAVRITDFTWREVAGRLDERLFDITFMQWTQLSAGTLLPFSIPKTYRPGNLEDLRDVAVRWYRDISQWHRIATTNASVYKKYPKIKPPLIPQEKIGKTKKTRPVILKLPNPTG